MMCDFIYCMEIVNFGQFEIKFGIIFGVGGS